MENELTDFGFNFGSLEVTRVAQESNGAAIISIKTPKPKLTQPQ